MKFNYKLYKLKNGAQILLIPSKEPYSVTVTAMLKSGSAFENKSNSGITHFLEHTAMQATEKWPDKVQLNTLLEELGGECNATTSYEKLKYYLTVPYNKLDFAIEFIYEVLYKSVFNKDYVEIERSIILDEYNNRLDDPYYTNFLFVTKSVSKNKTAYQFPILGNEKNIKKFTKQDLLKYRTIYHDPSRLLLVVIGNFDTKKAKDLITERFKDVPSNRKNREYPKQLLKTQVVKTKQDDKTNLLFNTIVIPNKGRKDITPKESALINLTTSILGGPFTSRLVDRLREKEGLLYSIYSYHETSYNSGAFVIHTSYHSEIFKKVFSIIIEELNKFIENGVTEKELKHFRNYITNKMLVKYDNVYAISGLIAMPIFYNKKVHSLKERIKIYNSISLNEINDYIRKNYKLDKANAFAYGNTKSSMTTFMKKELQLK